MKTIMTILPAVLLILVLLTGCASKDAAEKKAAGYQQISQEEYKSVYQGLPRVFKKPEQTQHKPCQIHQYG